LGKAVLHARKKTIRIDVFLGHKLMCRSVAMPICEHYINERAS
jgi:hypothetical protein